jgi:hypothetical protein
MESEDRIERLLALILLSQLGQVSQANKIAQLNLAGFTNIEIADLLNTTTAVVAQAIYEGKKTKTKTTAKTKKKS